MTPAQIEQMKQVIEQVARLEKYQRQLVMLIDWSKPSATDNSARALDVCIGATVHTQAMGGTKFHEDLRRVLQQELDRVIDEFTIL